MKTIGQLTEIQTQALFKCVDTALCTGMASLAGYAGTGKTFTAQHIVAANVYGLKASDVIIVTLAHTASKRLQRGFKDSFNINVKYATIASLTKLPLPLRNDGTPEHRELCEAVAAYDDDPSPANELRKETAARAFVKLPSVAFERVDTLPEALKDKRLILLDEASMVSLDEVAQLASFGIPIIAIGDPAQLPCVDKSGAGFDLNNPTALLTEVQRQKEGSGLLRFATAIRNGEAESFDLSGWQDIELRTRDIDLGPFLEAFDDHRAKIIAYRNDTIHEWNHRVRSERGYRPDRLYRNEPLLNYNTCPKIPLYNGSSVSVAKDTGYSAMPHASKIQVRDDRQSEFSCIVSHARLSRYRNKQSDYAMATMGLTYHDHAELDFGYAITCHKAQGLEYPTVIIDYHDLMCHDEADKMLYTAVTRASKKLVIVR